MLDRGKDGGELTQIDNDTHLPISVVGDGPSNDDALDLWRSRRFFLHEKLLKLCNKTGMKRDRAVGAWVYFGSIGVTAAVPSAKLRMHRRICVLVARWKKPFMYAD